MKPSSTNIPVRRRAITLEQGEQLELPGKKIYFKERSDKEAEDEEYQKESEGLQPVTPEKKARSAKPLSDDLRKGRKKHSPEPWDMADIEDGQKIDTNSVPLNRKRLPI